MPSQNIKSATIDSFIKRNSLFSGRKYVSKIILFFLKLWNIFIYLFNFFKIYQIYIFWLGIPNWLQKVHFSPACRMSFFSCACSLKKKPESYRTGILPAQSTGMHYRLFLLSGDLLGELAMILKENFLGTCNFNKVYSCGAISLIQNLRERRRQSKLYFLSSVNIPSISIWIM